MTDRMEKIIAAGEADHEAVRLQERAAVVAWLRAEAKAISMETAALCSIRNTFNALACAIERGEHIKPATDGGKV